jgi:hypothetical protein
MSQFGQHQGVCIGKALPALFKPSEEQVRPPKVVWQPLAGSQSRVLSCPCNEILYEGTRGPGKTDAQLMYFRRFVGQGYGRFWRGVVFDRKYKNLDDIIAKANRWFPLFEDGANFIQGGGLRWEWPTGEALLFRHMMRLSDYHNYHGHEYPYIAWNELTKQPTSELYDMMKSCNRSSFIPELHSPDLSNPLPDIPLVTFSTTNPHGPGHIWVKKHWRIGDVAPGVVMRDTKEIFNPRTQKKQNVTRTKIRLFGSYKENIYLPPEYVLELENTTDPNRRKAWLLGDWDIDVGGALEGVWSPQHQKLPRFKVPANWKITRSFDWGSTHPFSVGWWARSNGEDVKVSANHVLRLPPGSLIRFAEWYGTEDIGTNRGIKMSARNIAKGIKEREQKYLANGWIQTTPDPGPADGQIYSVNETESHSIASKMLEEGIEWYPADKRSGSRKNGLQLMRDALENSINGEGAGLYFMDNCEAALTTLPILPRDEDDMDDVDTTAEDHPYDDVRYMVLDNAPDFARSLKVLQPH